jgi:vacuolar-type H+-ATPase subunit E/Vma4
VAQEVAALKLKSREQIIESVFEQARGQIEKLAGQQYRDSITQLAVEALKGMPEGETIIKIGAPAGENLDANALASDIKQRLGNSGKNFRIEINKDMPKGIVADSADGKTRWDNTHAARQRRQKSDLRTNMVPILFEKE